MRRQRQRPLPTLLVRAGGRCASVTLYGRLEVDRCRLQRVLRRVKLQTGALAPLVVVGPQRAVGAVRA